ncbi:MAG: M23 family peptidase, partial [Methylacidiphilales bacterium]|nr:M23 family peptidase [Candidatus Methylacidiphilales bacterium]
MKIGRLIFSLFFTTATIYVTSPSTAQTQPNLPTRLIPLTTGKQTLLPDWQRISFSQMPSIQKSGSIKINGFSRQWKAGDTPDKYLTLGDVDEALKPQLFSLSNIANIINSPNTSTLDNFPLLGKQNLQRLAEIVPNLGDTTTAKIPAIAALLKAKYPQININNSLSNLLSQNPE